MAKVNLATDLTLAFTGAVRAALASGSGDPRAYLAAGRGAMQARAEHYIRLLGGAGRGGGQLDQAQHERTDTDSD